MKKSLKIKPRNSGGFTLIEIMIVILIIGILIAIAVPTWQGARSRTQAKVCISQLREICRAKETWAMEYKKDNTATPEMDDLHPSYIKEEPLCPAGGDYDIKAVSVDPTCSLGGSHRL